MGVSAGTITFLSPSLYFTSNVCPSLPDTDSATVALVMVELGRAYLYNKQDHRAITIFQEVLRRDSGNRLAKLEWARVLAYQGNLAQSNRLYQELLKTDPPYEAASPRPPCS